MAKYSYDGLTYEYLHSILTYDSETGAFYWKFRPRDMFNSDRIWKSWNSRWANMEAGTVFTKNNYYSRRYIDLLGRPKSASRLAWFMHYGEWPKDQIDHINGDALDNRIENLRDVNNTDNSRNKSVYAANKSGVTGVHWDKNNKKWCASIKVDYVNINLGSFIYKEDAIAARKEAEIKHGFHENHGRERVNAESE